MTTTEAALRDALAIVSQISRTDFPGRSIAERHRNADTALSGIAQALSQPSPASSTAGEGGRTMDGLRKERDRALFCMMDEAQRHLVALSRLQEAQAIVSCMYHRDNCTSSPDQPDMCGCGLKQLDRALTLPADHIEDVHGKVSGEPASVAVEAEARLLDIAAERAAQIRSSCFDYCTGDCNCAQAAEDAVSEMERLIAALSKPTPVEAGLVERLRNSIEALGEQGIGSNVSMSYEFACDLLAALSETQPPRETSTQEK